jgi:hypothetical protein
LPASIPARPGGSGSPGYHFENLVRNGDCVILLGMNGRWPQFSCSQLRIDHPGDLHRVETPLLELPIWRRGGVSQPLAFDNDSGAGRAVMLCDSFFRVGGLPGEGSGSLGCEIMDPGWLDEVS